MALSDKYTRSQLRSAIRREVLDPNTKFVTDAELNQYIDDWQDIVQSEWKFVWSTSTFTNTGSATLTLTDIATDMLGVGRVYWENRQVVPTSKEELELLDRNWRAFATSTQPRALYQDTSQTISFFPPPSSDSKEVIFEYPKELPGFATDTSTMEIPAWTKYSAITFGAFRTYLRDGPIQDGEKASRYKQLWQSQLQQFGRWFRHYFPKRSWALKPGTEYESDILDPSGPLQTLSLPSNVVSTLFEDEVPTGTVNGTNTAFTLTQNPDPDDSLALFLDGVRLLQGTDYTIVTTAITMTVAPVTGQTLFAHYRYTT